MSPDGNPKSTSAESVPVVVDMSAPSAEDIPHAKAVPLTPTAHTDTPQDGDVAPGVKGPLPGDVEGAIPNAVDLSTSIPGDETTLPAYHLPPLPPDGGYGWVIVFACFCCNGIVEGSVGSFGVFLPHFIDAFRSSRAKTTIAGSLLIGGFLISGAVVSGLINWLGCRVVTMVGAGLTVLAFTLCTLSPDLDVFIFVYGFVGGFGLAMIYLPAMVMVGYYFEHKRPLATGIAYSGAGIGMLVMAPVSAGLVSAYDWRNALVLLAAFPAQAAVLGALMRPLRAPPASLRDHPPLRTESDHRETENLIAHKDSNGIENKISEHMLLSTTAPCVVGPSKTQSMVTLPGRERLHDLPHLTLTASGGTTLLTQSCVDLPSDPSARRKSLVSHQVLNKYRKRRNKSLFISCKELLHFPEDIFKQLDLRKVQEKICKPLARQDVFYSGSLYQLAEYRSQLSMRSYRASVTGVAAHDLLEADPAPCSPCLPGCPRPTTLCRTSQLSLLTQPHFLAICLASTFIQLGYFIPVVFVSDYALSLSITQQKAAALISVIGVANTVGRAGAGALGNVPAVNILHLNNACLFLSGFTTFLVCTVCKDFTSLVIYAFLFGLFMGAFVPLTTIFLVKYLGLNHLNNAMGLLSMVRGISSMAGPPIAGALLDSYNSHEPVFYFAGAMFLAAGGAFYILPLCSPQTTTSDTEIDVPSRSDSGSLHAN